MRIFTLGITLALFSSNALATTEKEKTIDIIKQEVAQSLKESKAEILQEIKRDFSASIKSFDVSADIGLTKKTSFDKKDTIARVGADE